jgi:rSAM/selenodomain-associated transferase 1
MSRHLIIFIRNPQLGMVKTRLAATVGDERALEVYRKLLAITREAALGTQCERHLFYAEHPDQKDDWDPSFFQKREQKGRELGERMLNAFVEVFLQGAKQAVIIGSDCPEMSAGIIDDALSALETADVVIGPATDGGYYLLGMRELVPELFHDKQWSTSSVLRATLSDAERSGLRVHLLPPLSDLDDEADLLRSGL